MPFYNFVLSIPPGSFGNFSVLWLTSTMTMYKEVIMLLANDPDHLRSLWSLVTGGFCCSFDLILKETFKKCKISVEKLLLSPCIVSEFFKPASCKKDVIQWAQKQFILQCTGNSQSWYFASLIGRWNSYVEIISDERISKMCFDLLHGRWFHGKLPDGRKAAEMLLKQFNRGDGSFLVRESTTFVGDFSLSFWYV